MTRSTPFVRATRLVAVTSLLAIGVACTAGCGGSSAGGSANRTGAVSVIAPTPLASPSPARSPASLPRVAGRGPAPRSHAVPVDQATAARVDASSDAVLASDPGLIAPGAPSDAEIRRELQEARKAGIVLPGGSTAASFLNSSTAPGVAAQDAAVPGAEIPAAVWNPLSKPIADWIVPILQWAYQRGWRGSVTSGYRSYAEQAAINAAGEFSAPAGSSNHEFTAYPGGAVDVTDPGQLLTVLASYPGPEKLVGGVLGPVDPEHFSATGY